MIAERRITNHRFVLALTALGAVLLASVWIRAALQMSSRGFDLSDEGFYALSYRWWRELPRTYTGTQYFYGPIFQLLGYDVAKLRVFRVLTLVGSHVAFGWAFMQWLRHRRPNAPKSKLWETTGTALIVAAAGMQYGWLPLSPGYNDVAMIGGALATGFALRIATLVERGQRIPAWFLAPFGSVMVVLAFAKWSSAVTVLTPTFLVIAIVVFSTGGIRAVARVGGWIAGGALVFALFLEIFVVRFEVVVPQMLEVNRFLVKTGNSPTGLLAMYWDTTMALVKRASEQHELLFVAGAVAVVSRGRGAQVVAAVLAYVAARSSATRLEAAHALTGGAGNLGNYPLAITTVALTALLMILCALVGALITRFQREKQPSLVKDSLRGWLVLSLVALFPVSHGLGTGNPISFMIANAFSGWMAIILALATGLDGEAIVARWFGYALAGAAGLTSVLIASSGVLTGPYRTYGYEASTTVPAGVPALRTIRLRPDVAQQWSSLRASLAPYLEPKGRAMMGFDELAGLIFLLDGRPVGEAWSSAIDAPRTAEGFRSSCRTGKPWWNDRRPIFIFRRGVSATETNAFRDCGIDFAKDYKLLLPQGQTPMGLQVYVPQNE